MKRRTDAKTESNPVAYPNTHLHAGAHTHPKAEPDTSTESNPVGYLAGPKDQVGRGEANPDTRSRCF